jgi:beta-lactamase regulating signal transducer with metallopeptidase domain
VDAVVNWLWQGSVVALVTAAVLRLLHRSTAQPRYVVCSAALLAVLVLPLVPFVQLQTTVGRELVAHGPPVDPLVAVPEAWWNSSRAAIALWGLWSCAYGACVAWGVWAVRRTRSGCRPLTPGVEARLHTWSQVGQGARRAPLVVSDRVRAAAVLGCGAPMIAVAPDLVEQLSDDDLDRVVIHEWAHVQRRDDVASLIQLAIRVVAGWHPAVWWLDRRLRVEREIACDEIAVAMTGSARRYAACLVRLADRPSVPANMLAASGMLSSPALAARVLRILSPRHEPSLAWSRPAATAGVALLATLALVIGTVRIVETAGAAPLPVPRQTVVPEPAPSPGRVTPDRPGQVPEAQRSQQRTGNVDRAVPAAPNTPLLKQISQSPPSAEPDTGPSPETGGTPETPTPVVPARAMDFGPALVSGAVDLSEALQTASTPRASGVTPPPASDGQLTPWGAVANAGVAAGQGSKQAGVATAGFFSRLGKRIAGSF